ncbi:type IX secretion system sortase PorU [Neotamlana laminarinivorans]|uniref:Type IX secretion system sortase PorU n=1 Tax=Neotamlana laminarinivorans TaxID=2883124 RepID=A0A9X1I1D2_9FLAO|nr:type IX secretion system sortase PorU [Tamlana laminarinivorans]MCB4799175.1 type IX secretion system sortase PorU [Tamlana laminarinivorans]
MKKSFFLVFLLCSTIVYSQQKTYTISWDEKGKTVSGDGFSYEVPSFSNANYNFDFTTGLLFVDQWESSNIVNEASASISQVVYNSISLNELKDLDKNLIPNEVKFTLKNSISRNKRYAYFQISPIIKDSNGQFKKIISFKLNYDFGVSSKNITSKTFNNFKGITNSVLSSGDWYKFYVDTTGVFKLTRNFIQGLGVNVSSVDPRTIKIYGYGGRMIPYANSTEYPTDVPENAIKFIGEDDGSFDDEDYILFYAEGPQGYNGESQTHINCYTDKTYYYLNISSGNGKRISEMVQPTSNADLIISTFEDYKYYEVDDYNLVSLGRRWFGDVFDVETTKTYDFNFPDLVTSSPITLSVVVASTSSTSTSMSVSLNNNFVSNLSLSAISSPILASGASYFGNVNSTSSAISVQLDYDKAGNPSAIGYLDYISIKALRNLNFYGSQFQFENSEVETNSGTGQYIISNSTQLSEVWEVTDIYNVSSVSNINNDDNFSFKTELGSLKTYVALSNTDYFTPNSDSNTTVSNQNLKGTIFNNGSGVFEDIDYIIVSPTNMLSQAQRLANINEEQYNLNIKVITLDEIYAEFSTGNPDVAAIRNFVKYVYNNASSTDARIKYLCLFGDSSYDYKNRVSGNTNIVPSWHTYNSFSLTSSFISDDFYGLMDDNEGNLATSDKLDIAIGRILADTPQRAIELVDKIESYYNKESFGSWRNNFVVISDDVDEDWEGLLQETTDNVGNLVSDEKPFINVVKIHSDSFQQETSAGGDRYPDVATEIVNAIDNGALVINYFGHGGEDGLAEEQIFLKTDINNLRNLFKLNCFVTVTCEFTRFDNPLRETAGELTYWNETAGAIGLITTTRQIFVSFAINFNNTLGQYLFSYSDDDDYGDYEYPSMAEALRLAKSDPAVASSSQKRLIFFIGDPAMKLAFPEPNIALTEINDVPVAQATDTLKALGRVKLAGQVTDLSGNLLSNYNGTLSTTIYDKPIERETLANDGTRLNGELVVLDFETLGEIIFRGQASITNGEFEFEFIVPKDIGIPVDYGKVSFYAKNTELTQNQTGASVNTVLIGGLNEDAPEDNEGPMINLFMNDESFVSGGITNESPTLLVKLEDLNGINTASGIGHDIEAVLDGDETNPITLNSYYQTEVDDYTKGVVTYLFNDLEPGLHTLTLTAWDVYNNSSTAEIQFIVYDEDEQLVIENVLNYPNPFVNYTEFWFNHNSSESLDVSIQIFTVSGKLVRTLNGQTTSGIVTTGSLSRDIIWDGRDDFGDKIGKGVYIYKLKVHSNLLNKTVEKIEKLVIL